MRSTRFFCNTCCSRLLGRSTSLVPYVECLVRGANNQCAFRALANARARRPNGTTPPSGPPSAATGFGAGARGTQALVLATSFTKTMCQRSARFAKNGTKCESLCGGRDGVCPGRSPPSQEGRGPDCTQCPLRRKGQPAQCAHERKNGRVSCVNASRAFVFQMSARSGVADQGGGTPHTTDAPW